MTALPWTKDEIIAAVKAEIDPPEPGKMSIKPVPMCALARLALGKPEGGPCWLKRRRHRSEGDDRGKFDDSH
jgi:hypothetical protein